jgi:NADH-quinone oxidoreductase subunit J
LEELLFYALAVGSVACACGVVASRNPLFSVLSLLGAFFCMASIYLLAGFQFIAATQLLVYAGAIMVLFLFVVMLLNLGDESLYADRPKALGRRRVALAAGAAASLLFVAAFSVGLRPVLAGAEEPPSYSAQGVDDLQGIAELLFSRYVIPFEASSLLLLSTMIAVILLAKRQRPPAGGERAGWPWQRGAAK